MICTTMRLQSISHWIPWMVLIPFKYGQAFAHLLEYERTDFRDCACLIFAQKRRMFCRLPPRSGRMQEREIRLNKGEDAVLASSYLPRT